MNATFCLRQVQTILNKSLSDISVNLLFKVNSDSLNINTDVNFTICGASLHFSALAALFSSFYWRFFLRLRFVFGPCTLQALDLVDKRAVTLVFSPSGREAFQV